jgi:hypothetical protein
VYAVPPAVRRDRKADQNSFESTALSSGHRGTRRLPAGGACSKPYVPAALEAVLCTRPNELAETAASARSGTRRANPSIVPGVCFAYVKACNTTLVAIAAFVVFIPVTSRAGTYQVTACDAAPSFSNNSWAASNDSPLTLEQAEICPSAGGQWNGLRSYDKLASPNTAAGREAAYHFDAPAGTTIVDATLIRWIGKHGTNSWIPFIRADSMIVETCTIPGGELSCEAGASGGAQRSYSGLSAARLSVGLRCGQAEPNTCSNGGTIHSAWGVLYGATVVVSDPHPPSIMVDAPGSSLFSGWVHGTRQLAVAASDAESGVRELQVFDGERVRRAVSVGEAAGGCGTPNAGLAYTFPQPCAGSRGMNGSRTLHVDATDWQSGVYGNVLVRALDAGGEVGQAGPFTVSVDNDAPTNIRFTGLPPRLRVTTGRRIKGIGATADDPHSGVASVGLEWRDNDRPGSDWRAYRAGQEPLARAGHHYQFRARAVDRVGNMSADEFSPGLLARRAPVLVLGARLRGGHLVLIARAPRGRVVRLGLRLRARRSGVPVRTRLRVKGRVVRRIRLPLALRGTSAARLVVSYRRGGRVRVRSAGVTMAGVRLRLPL